MQACHRYSLDQDLVSRALSARQSGKGASVISETSQVLRPQLAEAQTAQGAEKEISLPILQGDQVLPIDHSRLGRSRFTSLPPGLQHAESLDSSKESELLAFGFQLQ